MRISGHAETTDPTARVSRWTLFSTAIGFLAVGLVAASRSGTAADTERSPNPSRGGAHERAAAAPSAGSDFWAHWGDGRAELDGYELTQPRYGESRRGRVIHIFVTEPFSVSDRVKADPGRHPKADVVQVLKLNEVRTFQTGIYDYDMMTSLFVPLASQGAAVAGQPLKLAFSSQEWCGMMYEELLFDADYVRQRRFSYFDGESSEKGGLLRPAGGVSTDELPVWIRGLVGGFQVAAGEKKRLPLLPSVVRARLLHRDLRWVDGTIERDAESHVVEVPAGRFEVARFAAQVGDDAYVYDVELAHPHRVVAWRGPDGERAELRGSTRLPYWNLNQEGQERFLSELGFATKP